MKPWQRRIAVGVAALMIFIVAEGYWIESHVKPRDKTVALLSMLVHAIRSYREEFGEFPQGTDAEVMWALTTRRPSGFSFLDSNMRRSFSPTGELLDGWGTPYRFDLMHTPRARIYSCGPNKQDDKVAANSDDIGVSL
jgi:hypothetical protein